MAEMTIDSPDDQVFRVFVYKNTTDTNLHMRAFGILLKMVPAQLKGFKACKGSFCYYYLPEEKGVITGWILSLTSKQFAKFDRLYKIGFNFEKLNDEVFSNAPGNQLFASSKLEVRLSDHTQAEAVVYLPIIDNWKPGWLEGAAPARPGLAVKGDQKKLKI